MKNLRQNGFAVMTLTDMVDDFCLAQGNLREAVITANYRHARWAWKDLFRTTLWEIRTAVLELNCRDHSFRIPSDCERIINISVMDCYGKLHPLGFNSDWNTAKIKCTKVQCSCGTCNGEGTLCAAVDSISSVFTTVVINDQDYTQTTLTRYNANGTISKETITPSWDVESSTVIFNTNSQVICNVETTESGCIKVTQANMDTLRTYCGCGNYLDEWGAWGYGWGEIPLNRQLIPAPYNYWGEWNYNAADRTIIHIFGNARQGATHFNNCNQQEEDQWRTSLSQVILQYQTNGEVPATEILVPEYAVEAVQVGMFWRQKRLHPRMGPGEREAARMDYEREKTKVAMYLNPITLDLLAKQQTNARLW